MHYQPFHAPLRHAPRRILDIGCGTGAITALLARTFPEAEVVGFDMAPAPSCDMPDNVTFVQGNISGLEDLSKRDARFAPDRFDYIFHRLLIFGVTDWPAYVRSVCTMLAPGGWAEMQDFEMGFFNANGEALSEHLEYFRKFKVDLRASWIDPEAGRNLWPRVKEAGFENVSERIYKTPAVRDPSMPEGDILADLAQWRFAREHVGAMIERISGARRPKDEVEQILSETLESRWGSEAGAYEKFYVVTGRKPLEKGG